jgi:hypothetical protein
MSHGVCMEWLWGCTAACTAKHEHTLLVCGVGGLGPKRGRGCMSYTDVVQKSYEAGFWWFSEKNGRHVHAGFTSLVMHARCASVRYASRSL